MRVGMWLLGVVSGQMDLNFSGELCLSGVKLGWHEQCRVGMLRYLAVVGVSSSLWLWLQ